MPQAPIDLIARQTGLTEEAVQQLMASGGLVVDAYYEGGDNSIPSVSVRATTPEAAGALVDAQPGYVESLANQTGTADSRINRIIALGLTMGLGYDQIVDGDALARYGITDPAQVESIKQGMRNWQEVQNQQRTTSRRESQADIRRGIGLVAGGGLALNALAPGAAGAGSLGDMSLGLDFGPANLGALDTAATAFPVADTAAGITTNTLGLAEGTAAATGATTATNLAPVVERGVNAATQLMTPARAMQIITNGAARLLGGGGGTETGGRGGLLGPAATLLTGAGLVAAGVRAGGGTTQTTQTTTAAPATAEERDLWTLIINRIKADDALYSQLAPYYQAQVDGLIADLGRSRASEPAVIRNFVNANLDNPTAIHDAMLQFGITASQVGTAMGYTPQQVSEYTGVPLNAAERSFARQERIETIQLENLERGTAATKEQIDLINQATGAAREAGLANIDRFVQQTTARINEEVASALGLNPQDTPIQTMLGTSPEAMRLGTGVLGESTRQAGILESNLQQANVQARLNYPLAAAGVANATAASAGSLNLAAQDFQNQLSQQATANRYRLFANPYQLPQGGTAAGSLALNMGQQRLGQSTVSQTGSRSLNVGDYARLAGGVGSLMYGSTRLFP